MSRNSTPPPRIRNDLPSIYPWRNKLVRALWGLVWWLLFRPTPPQLHRWRLLLLRMFGATVAPTARIASSATIWAPWNITLDDCAEVGPHVILYSVARIRIGIHATVSQYSYLCAGSRDISDPLFRPTKAPITVGDQAWVAAGAYIGPGVTIGEGAVVAAKAVVFSDVAPWRLCAGNPSQIIGSRILRAQSCAQAIPENR